MDSLLFCCIGGLLWDKRARLSQRTAQRYQKARKFRQICRKTCGKNWEPVLGYRLTVTVRLGMLVSFGKNAKEKLGSSRKVRETNREEPNEHKEETVISVAISKALGNFNLVIESLKFTC